MVEIICAAIAGAATVICAFVAHRSERRGKREDARAEKRAEEGRLQLAMLSANNKLTIGLAMAVKTGHANGEIEEGLKHVEEAQGRYRQFLENLAIDQIRT